MNFFLLLLYCIYIDFFFFCCVLTELSYRLQHPSLIICIALIHPMIKLQHTPHHLLIERVLMWLLMQLTVKMNRSGLTGPVPVELGYTHMYY